jgi:glycosyltransferase involved in cell wall biosynthesis
MVDPSDRIVSLTPLPLARDSRTLKIARSLSRFGYRSMVVENRPGRAPESFLPVKLKTLGWIHGRRYGASWMNGSTDSADSPSGDDPFTRIKKVLLPLTVAAIRERLHYLIFIAAYLFIRPVQGLFQVPAARLYYLHEYRLFPLLRLIRTFRRPVPFIYDAHDFYMNVRTEESLSPFWKKRFLPFLSWLESQCVSEAAAVVTVSEGCADLFKRHYGIRPLVVRNCHDQRLDKPVTVSLRERTGVSAGDFLIAVIGNRKPGQAIEPMLSALSALPECVHVAFIGRFHDDTADLAAKLGVSGRVHTPGFVEPEQIVPFVQSADVAAILYVPETENLRSTLPNGLFQSLSAQLPLLYPDLPEIRGILSSYDVGRKIDPSQTDSITEAAAWMLDNKEDVAVFRKNLSRLADEVSWQREEEKLRLLVERLISPV